MKPFLPIKHLAWIGVLVVPLLGAALWIDPHRSDNAKEHAAARRVSAAEEKAWLTQKAQAQPPAGRLDLDFWMLGFQGPDDGYDPSNEQRCYAKWLPDAIKSYDGREVSIQGFMLPTKMENGRVRECLVLANQGSCCFGIPPRFCEFIVTKLDSPVPRMMDRPLHFKGKLHVGDTFDHGSWSGLYSLDCTGVQP